LKVKKREKILLEEKNGIDAIIAKYSIIPTNFFIRLYYSFMRNRLINRKNILNNKFNYELHRPFEEHKKSILSKNQKLEYLESNINEIVKERSSLKSQDLYRAKELIETNNSLLLGAIGEQKAVDELKKLPDSYTIINDFSLEIDPPLVDMNSGSNIHSIQADHLVIGPTGIFLIETKNWSKNSIEKTYSFSPIDQIQRTNYALFCFLNYHVNSGQLDSFRNNWGSAKISPRNIILMIHSKPNEEFQYVKVLTINEVRRYITNSKIIFNEEQTFQLVEFIKQGMP